MKSYVLYFIFLAIFFAAPVYPAGVAVSIRHLWCLKFTTIIFGILGFGVCLSMMKRASKQNRNLEEKAGAACLEVLEVMRERNTMAAMGGCYE